MLFFHWIHVSVGRGSTSKDRSDGGRDDRSIDPSRFSLPLISNGRNETWNREG